MMIGRIIRKILWFRDWKYIVWDEPTDFDVPFQIKLKYALRGFSANEYIWYDLKHNDYRDYISEFERLRSREINGNYKFILDDKLVFEEIFGQYTKVPKNYAMISDGVVYGLHNIAVNNSNFSQFVRNAGKTILKWTDRGGGIGTYLFESCGEKLLSNGVEITDAELDEIRNRKGNALLCEYIEQSEFAASLYPHTTNTIRIVCARMKRTENMEIICAIQRIGCKESIPVDNAHAGGMTCAIDLNTGRISCGIARLGKMENRMKRFEHHPDTNMQISGKLIPGWSRLKKEIIELSNKIPYLNFVAWDVLLTEEGYCIIEGNASSGCGIFQMERGVRNDLLGEIYRSYGVIK